MRRTRFLIALLGGGLIAAGAGSRAADCHDGSCTSCTGPGLAPRCKASWKEEKTKPPLYSMRCEYACARGRDSWHAPEPECRCRPPCGQVYVKKRLYKAEGKEKVERVPKYEVETVPVGGCGCAACRGGHGGWDPLGLLALFHHR